MTFIKTTITTLINIINYPCLDEIKSTFVHNKMENLYALFQFHLNECLDAAGLVFASTGLRSYGTCFDVQ